MTFETGRMITCLITRLSAMTSVLGVCEKTYQNHFLYIIGLEVSTFYIHMSRC